jgi:hypothetical protein
MVKEWTFKYHGIEGIHQKNGIWGFLREYFD